MFFLMRSLYHRLGLVAATVLALSVGSAAASAQSSLGEGRRQAKRSELETAARATEQAATVAPDAKTKERLLRDAAAIKQRLRNGDFLPGDRIYVSVLGDSALTDTFTVRGDRRLQLPNIPDISLAGVLDAELSSFLATELGKYLKNPVVSATGLIRLTITGGVGQNGFLTFPVDQAITDVLMSAGGLSQGVKIDGTKVRRSGEVIIDGKQFGEAVRLGRTIGDMSLRDGDEIQVPTVQTGGANRLTTTLRIMTVTASMLFTLRWLTRSRRP